MKSCDVANECIVLFDCSVQKIDSVSHKITSLSKHSMQTLWKKY